MKIAEVIKPEGVTIDLAVSSKDKLLQILSKKAGAVLGLSDKKILSALQGREKLGSTGIGAGIAIPHAPVAGITTPFGLFVRLARPIAFNAIDDLPVDIVCMVLMPPDGQSAYLKVLSSIARRLRSPDTAKRIRSAPDSQLVHSAIAEEC